MGDGSLDMLNRNKQKVGDRKPGYTVYITDGKLKLELI